jgi:hypothetical protein
MKLIEWLKKLGILQVGVQASVYRNAKERPDDLFDPNHIKHDTYTDQTTSSYSDES